MLSQAQQQTAQILDQNEIVQTAYQRAEDIMRQATEEAERLVNAAQDESDQMRKAALLYTNDLLSEAQGHVEESLREIDNKSRMLTSALKNSIDFVFDFCLFLENAFAYLQFIRHCLSWFYGNHNRNVREHAFCVLLPWKVFLFLPVIFRMKETKKLPKKADRTSVRKKRIAFWC